MTVTMDVIILACDQAAPNPAAWVTPLADAGLNVRVVPEPCSSKVEVFQLLRLLARHADLVWVVGCPVNLCRLIEGSARLERRLVHAQDYLAEIGLPRERLGFSLVAADDSAGRAAAVAVIRTQALALGPNPGRRRPPAGKE